MAKPSEYTLFLNYGEKVKNFLQTNCYLKKYPKEENVKVFFSTPSMAFAKFIIPVINGSNLNPTVSFYLSGIEYIKNENLLGFVKKTSRIEENTYIDMKPHLIYRLSYKVSILTGNERDADIVQYQLLTRAPFRKPYSFNILNQWGTLYTDNPSVDTELVPGEVRDKMVQRGLELIVPRAYLPVESELHDGIIEEINLNYEANWNSI